MDCLLIGTKVQNSEIRKNISLLKVSRYTVANSGETILCCHKLYRE